MSEAGGNVEAAPDLRPHEARGRTMRRQGVLLAVLLAGLLLIAHQGFFFYVTLVACGIGLLCWAVASHGLSAVTIDQELSAAEVEIGAEVMVRVVVKSRARLPIPWLLVADQIDDGHSSPGTPAPGEPTDSCAGASVVGPSSALLTLPGNARRELRYTIVPRLRGLYRVGPVLLEASGPLGLVRRFLLAPRASFLTVLPTVVPLGGGLPVVRPVHQVARRRSLNEDPSRFLGIREHQVGDDRRRIHFRATARAGRLQSKVYEPSVLEGLLLCVEMDARRYPGLRGAEGAVDPQVELVVTAAASIARHVLCGGGTVGLFASGADAAERYPRQWTKETFRRLDRALSARAQRRPSTRLRPVEVPPGRGAWQEPRLRTALARLQPSSAGSLPQLLLSELPRLPRDLVVTVVTPVLDGALAAALAALARSGIDTSVIWICPPAAEPNADGRKAPQVPAGTLPARVPVHRVVHTRDLQALGGGRL